MSTSAGNSPAISRVEQGVIPWQRTLRQYSRKAYRHPRVMLQFMRVSKYVRAAFCDADDGYYDNKVSYTGCSIDSRRFFRRLQFALMFIPEYKSKKISFCNHK